MAQIIIYTNSNNGVSVCQPTGELPIEEVLAKDCPQGAIIVDDSVLPTGANAQFFDAWELNDTTISVNIEKAKSIKLTQFNANAVQEAQNRQLNTLSGIPNKVTDAEFIANLNAGRIAIANATTIDQLILINNPT